MDNTSENMNIPEIKPEASLPEDVAPETEVVEDVAFESEVSDSVSYQKAQPEVRIPQQPTPSMIYYSNQTDDTPQYHYGNSYMGSIIYNRYYMEQGKRAEAKAKLSKRLKQVGNLVGAAMIATYLLMYVLMFVLQAARAFAGPNSIVAQVYNSFSTTVTGGSLLQLIYTLTVVGGGFLVFRKLISVACTNDINTPLKKGRKSKCASIPLGAPEGGARVPLLILISFGGCMLANYVTIFFSIFYGMFGLTSGDGGAGPSPQTGWDIASLVCANAIVPALIEELALRGIVMTPLRKYGSGFAILISAFAFGIFHGDLDQIPFAFICGLFMGYAVVITESLWTGIVIHALNNSISCIQATIIMKMGEGASGIFFFAISGLAILVGVIALIIYLKLYKKEDFKKLKSGSSLMNTSSMFKSAVASPVMIVAILLFVFIAIKERLPVVA